MIPAHLIKLHRQLFGLSVLCRGFTRYVGIGNYDYDTSRLENVKNL